MNIMFAEIQEIPWQFVVIVCVAMISFASMLMGGWPWQK
jgi:hypothetical protein